MAKVELEGELKATERRKITHPISGAAGRAGPLYVAIKLFLGSIPMDVYWGVYPADKFFDRQAT